MAEQARQRVEDLRIPRTRNNSEEGVVTVSIGLASMIPIKGRSKNLLIELADQALYEAKHRGRNNIVEKIGTHLTVV